MSGGSFEPPRLAIVWSRWLEFNINHDCFEVAYKTWSLFQVHFYFLIVLGLLLLDYFQIDSQPALDKFNLELVFWTSRAQRILIDLE